jgi:hypothetical protein
MTTLLKNHEVKAEWVDDKYGPAVMLTQTDGWGDDGDQTVILHPYQLRHICEHFGILAADVESEMAVKTLQRRMLALRDRIESLATWIGGQKKEGQDAEMSILDALQVLANEWCSEFTQNEAIENPHDKQDEKPRQKPKKQAD